MDEDREFCASCCSGNQVTWCPAFDQHLCAMCRTQATHKLLDTPVTALPVRDNP